MANPFDLTKIKERLKWWLKSHTEFEYNGSVYTLKVDDGEIWLHFHEEDEEGREIQVNITHYSPEGYDFQLFHGHIESMHEFSVIMKTLKL